MKKNLSLAAALFIPLSVLAQADVAATGQAIAAALNKRDVEALYRTLDVEAVTKMVVKDLGLKDADRDAVSKGFPKALRSNLEIGVRTIDGTKGAARYMRSGTRDGRPYALVRYDLNEQGIDYVEYYLTPARKVEDWYVHSLATLYSTSARLGLATMLKTDTMLFGLFGTRLTTDADVKPFRDLRDRLQAQDFAGAYRALELVPEGFR